MVQFIPPFTFRYKNHRGEVGLRIVEPISTRFGSTIWHPKPQWLLLAYDFDKKANREFAMDDMEKAKVEGDDKS